MPNANLFAWADKQPDWLRDALRRHATAANFELGAEDKTQVLRRARQAAGMADAEACENLPISADHMKDAAAGAARTVLVSLGPVKNLARLAPDQRLSFALDGITLVYGDNGTGKSGYCRITKKICRSLTSEDLLGDVFSGGEKSRAEIAVGYRIDGEADVTNEVWTDGTPPPKAVAGISVFDARNARLYVDAENRIGFLPREVALLEQFARHCVEMDGTISAELRGLKARINVPLPAGYAADGAVAKLFQRLALKKVLPTADEIKTEAAWTEKDKAELEALEKLLAQDPKALADRYRRAATLLKAYAKEAAGVGDSLTEERADSLAQASALANTTAEAAALAAAERFKDEPLAGAGSQPWRFMYDYAEKYVQSLGVEALPAKEGDPCALCQEPLSANAAARMERFASFVGDQASKAADAARVALEAEVSALKALVIPKQKDIENALADYRQLGDEQEGIAVLVIGYFGAAESRCAGLVAAEQKGDFEGVGGEAGRIDGKLDGEVAALEAKAAELDKAAADGSVKRLADRARLSQLKDRKKLADDLATVLARLAELEMAAKLAKCGELLNTRPVSNQITALRRDLVTADLEKRIQSEIEALDLTHLPFKVNDRSEDGKSNFRVLLDTPAGVANDKVLSEGEQRALALACFFGELGGDAVKAGIVIDDPVSSLDHIRIRRVAQRIAEEAAKGKQIIVFTHNLLFYNEVADAAARSTPQVPVIKRIFTKSEEKGFGLISESDEPWIARKVTDRIALLQEKVKGLAGRTDFASDGYRSAAKDFYTDLRETWERLVEEVLLGKTVERFNTDVRTQSLKGVVVEDDDYAKVYWAMKRVSERSGHDMAAGKNLPPPKPDDMKADLKEIEDYRAAVNTRRKDTDKRRAELEKPPKAQTL